MCESVAEFVIYNADANLIQHPVFLQVKHSDDLFDGRYCTAHAILRIRAMGYRTPVVANFHVRAGFDCDGIPEPLHSYSFEVWVKDQIFTSSYPMQIPRHTSRILAATIEEARERARETLEENEVIGAPSHQRASCIPPHTGRD